MSTVPSHPNPSVKHQNPIPSPEVQHLWQPLLLGVLHNQSHGPNVKRFISDTNYFPAVLFNMLLHKTHHLLLLSRSDGTWQLGLAGSVGLHPPTLCCCLGSPGTAPPSPARGVLVEPESHRKPGLEKAPRAIECQLCPKPPCPLTHSRATHLGQLQGGHCTPPCSHSHEETSLVSTLSPSGGT